jgi:glycopeptide antibiotics resistance protein
MVKNSLIALFLLFLALPVFANNLKIDNIKQTGANTFIGKMRGMILSDTMPFGFLLNRAFRVSTRIRIQRGKNFLSKMSKFMHS